MVNMRPAPKTGSDAAKMNLPARIMFLFRLADGAFSDAPSPGADSQVNLLEPNYQNRLAQLFLMLLIWRVLEAWKSLAASTLHELFYTTSS